MTTRLEVETRHLWRLTRRLGRAVQQENAHYVDVYREAIELFGLNTEFPALAAAAQRALGQRPPPPAAALCVSSA